MSATPRTDAEMERTLGDPSPEFTRGLELELAAYHKTHRWNVRDDRGDDSLLICRGGHERSEECDEQRYVPAEPLEQEIVRLRAALEDIGTTAHCLAKAGPLHTPTLAEAWPQFMRLDRMATAALNPSRYPVVGAPFDEPL